MINRHKNLFVVTFLVGLIAYIKASKSDPKVEKSNQFVSDTYKHSSSQDIYIKEFESLASRIRLLEEEIAKIRKPLDESCSQRLACNTKVSLTRFDKFISNFLIGAQLIIACIVIHQ